MAKKQTNPGAEHALDELTPTVAALLTDTIYRARLFNRQARMNVAESETIAEVVDLWRNVMAALEKKPE